MPRRGVVLSAGAFWSKKKYKMFNNNLLCKIYDIDKVKKVKKSPAGGWFLLEKMILLMP